MIGVKFYFLSQEKISFSELYSNQKNVLKPLLLISCNWFDHSAFGRWNAYTDKNNLIYEHVYHTLEERKKNGEFINTATTK